MEKPTLFFKDFDNDWKHDKLSNIVCRITRKNSYLDSKLPLTISATEGLVSQLSYFNNIVASTNISNYYLLKKGEFAYNKSYSKGYPFGSVKRLDNYEMGVLSTLYIVFGLKQQINFINSDYIKIFFETTLWHHDVAERSEEGARNHGLLNIGVDDFFDISISFPKQISEQKNIASFFENLNAIITATNNKLTSLQRIRKACLQSMFPQVGESVPKIRFKGFENKWKCVKIGDLFLERNESNINGEMLSVTMSQGIIRASENGRFDNSNSDKSKYKVVCVNDIAYNSMRMWQGASGCSKYNGIVSPAYTVLIPGKNVDSLFFSYLFKTDLSLKLFKLNSQGLTSDNWNLKYPTLSRIKVFYPTNIAEQQKIALYFENLDKQITLQTLRLEKLRQIKAACLDNMFV